MGSFKMNEREKKVFLETKLRNLKNVHSKMIVHSDLVDETLRIEKEINWLEEELASL